MTIRRIGFACKLSILDPKKGAVSIPRYNTQTTTITWLNRQTRDVAVEKLWMLAKCNIESIKNLVDHVGNFPHGMRMVRLGSDILPAYTHENWRWFYKQPEFINYAERHFAKVGEIARQKDVRISFHPGQFVVLASIDENIVQRSIEEFEYHVDMARWMGYGQRFQDMKINVHIAGRAGPDGIRAVYPRLSQEAQNTLTIENDEMSWGIDASLELADLVPLVLDGHHHWVKTGEWIDPRDDRVKRIFDSWRDVRPVIHYSISREDILVDHCRHTMPDLFKLLERGHKKAKLRAHSDYFWNHAVNQWALQFGEYADTMCESKCKNLASKELFEIINQ
jgi:UV damage endonuclease UvdE